MPKKTAQVNIFIILGIVILLAALVFFLVRQETAEKREPSIIGIEKIPLQLQPVAPFVESCIKQVAVEGLNKLGDRGGYIEPWEFGIAASRDSSEGNAVQFSGGSGLEVPYWFYLKSGNECTGSCEFSIEMPPLKGQNARSIESQLSKYVDEKLKNCLKDFVDVKKQGIYVAEKGIINTDVMVRDSDILLKVNYPLEIKKEESVTSMEDFNVIIDLNLKNIYNLASEIVNLEQEHRFLEKDVLNLIVGFSAKSEDKLPPMSDAGLEFGSSLYWSKSKVKNNIENMLASYIQLLQVDGTANYEPYEFAGDKLKDALYNIGMAIPLNYTTNLEASFDYIGWPIYFDLNCNGDLCQPESVSVGFIDLPGLQRYNFAYDLSFPVLVTIHDSSALNTKGYSFRFFIEGNIRNNDVMKTDFMPLQQISLDTGSMLCDINKRNSGNITVKVSDAENKPVSSVQIAYTCAEESCFIGKTDEKGIFSGSFPVCAGGIISYLKDGYAGKSEILNTELGKDGSKEALLDKVYDKTFTIKKKKVVKTSSGWQFQQGIYELENEQATLSLSKKIVAGEAPLSAISEYNAGDDAVEIKVAPGEYFIDINMLSNDTIIIPARTEKEGSWPLEEEVDYPRVEFNESNPYNSGGLRLNYTFKNEDLANANKIVFYAVNIDLKGVPESERRLGDLEEMNKVEEYSNKYANSLRPDFVMS